MQHDATVLISDIRAIGTNTRRTQYGQGWQTLLILDVYNFENNLHRHHHSLQYWKLYSVYNYTYCIKALCVALRI
jgi:hypothetical protein